MNFLTKLLLAALFSGLLTSCVATETDVFENSPTALTCLLDRDAPEDPTIQADVPLELVVFDECRPTSIRQGHRFIDGWCTAEPNRELLEVESRAEFEYERNRWGGNVASSACAGEMLRCEVPALPAGEYELVHGTESTPFSVPSEDNLDCHSVRGYLGFDRPEYSEDSSSQ